jgi:hypothetical protein
VEKKKNKPKCAVKGENRKEYFYFNALTWRHLRFWAGFALLTQSL